MTSSNTNTTRAIILSAGQGRRLLPLTADCPKCLLPVAGKPVIEWQIDTLLTAGIEDITVVTGFRTAMVESLLQKRYASQAHVKVLFNPFFDISDNLASCWMARSEMNRDFLLLNGDTLFDSELLTTVLKSPSVPITLTVDHKPAYDADDMKVQLQADGWVQHVSKTLSADQIDAESIGLVYFREQGPQLFRHAVEKALQDPTGLKSWYLSVIDALAADGLVKVCSIAGHQWCEIDISEDLKKADSQFATRVKTDTDLGLPVTEEVMQLSS